QDIIDDRIDVVTRGLLGLTVTCARCHDHKFDPIPTKDYYSLYGVFASSTEPTVLPVLADPARKASFQAFEKELHAREEKLNQFLQKKQEELTARLRARVGDYLLAAEKMRRKPNTEEFMFVPAPEDLNPRLVERWQRYLEGTRAGFHPVFGPWHAFAALPAKEFAARAKDLATQFAANADPGKRINPVVARAFAGQAPTSLKEVAERYARLFTEADQLWQKQLQSGGGQSLKDPGQEQLRQVLYGPDAPANVPRNDLRRFLLDRAARDQLKKMRDEIDKFQANAPNAPPRAMVLEEAPTPYEPHVFLRGNPNRPGEAVPRQFLQILTGAHRQPFHHGSGRLELAQAMVDPRNPLTARVLVNRLWLHHFGAGLVRTPSDFGMRSEPPSHPELLDYLARKFMDDGWSIKKMHRLLMLSSVYQQSSDDNPRGPQVDPENRLLWHMNRQRLDFEALRDALLAVSGKLDRTMGGPSVSLTTPPFSTRRTVYGFVDRSNLPALFRTFDFPSPDTTSPQRYQTTVPLRALFLMNSPFVLEQARALANRPEIASQTRSDRKIQALYRLVYGRAAEPEETALGVHFLQDHHPEPSAGPRPGRALNALEQYAQVLLVSNEFAFVD
ncbi:MAG: DUF1553 domain-containing protein, partial [Planctomycetes bacterium]|nr:DUF1553 domain-containing protein [Planctomycetota bacterium]